MIMAAKKKAVRKAASKRKMVTMLLNGQTVGTVDPTGKSIAEVGLSIAREHGLKSYSILVNGHKVTDAGSTKPLSGAQTIECFAKETRGAL